MIEAADDVFKELEDLRRVLDGPPPPQPAPQPVRKYDSAVRRSRRHSGADCTVARASSGCDVLRGAEVRHKRVLSTALGFAQTVGMQWSLVRIFADDLHCRSAIRSTLRGRAISPAICAAQTGVARLSHVLDLADDQTDAALRRAEEVHRQAAARREREIAELRGVLGEKEAALDELRDALAGHRRHAEAQLREQSAALNEREAEVCEPASRARSVW